MDFRMAYSSVGRGVLYSIIIEFRITMKLVGLISVCLYETYNEVHVSKHMRCELKLRLGQYNNSRLNLVTGWYCLL
jgi:hypothetical protein